MESVKSQEPIEEGANPSSDALQGSFDLQAFADGIADGYEETVETKPSKELEELKAKVKSLEASLHNEEGKYKRLLADLQNLRNKTSKEIKMGSEQAEKKVLLEVLQVLDSFNRCMSSTYHDIEEFRTGVGLIEKQFLATLRRLNVTEIQISPGDPYDAHTAEALSAIDTDSFPPGCIAEVCEKGFRLGESLLRPARVVVARGEAGH